MLPPPTWCTMIVTVVPEIRSSVLPMRIVRITIFVEFFVARCIHEGKSVSLVEMKK